MLLCWNYIPENRVKFHEMNARLIELLSDENKEQPLVWFAYDPSLLTVIAIIEHRQ
jgi:hypothetical protein